jgi:hypothetical protein
VDVLDDSHLIRPPELKKLRAALAFANVIVCVVVIVQAEFGVLVACHHVPVAGVIVAPEVAEFALLVNKLDKSVARLFKIEIVLPATGAVLLVMVTPVWLPIELILLTRSAHCVAVTVPPADTVDNVVDCPYPYVPAPVPQIAFTLPLDVVLANPL